LGFDRPAANALDVIHSHDRLLESFCVLALLNVDLQPVTSPEALVPVGWSPLETAKEAVRGLSRLGQGLANVVIWAGVLAPAWVPLVAVAVYLGLRMVRRRPRRQ